MLRQHVRYKADQKKITKDEEAILGRGQYLTSKLSTPLDHDGLFNTSICASLPNPRRSIDRQGPALPITDPE